MRILRLIFFLLIVFLSLPEMTIGFPSLANAVRIHTTDAFYIRHDYLSDALFMLIPGWLAVLAAGFGAFFAHRANWVYFAIATAIVLWLAIAIPSWYRVPQRYAEDEVRTRILAINEAVAPWCMEHHRFPMSDQELADALAGNVSMTAESKYARGGASLRYQTVVIPNAKAGMTVPTKAPGQLFYMVASDGAQFWVLGTILPKPVTDTVVTTGQDLVVAPPCPTEATSAQQKK